MHDLAAVTVPATAWLIPLVPVALTVVALFLTLFLLRAWLMQAVVARAVQRAARTRRALPPDLVPDVALVWLPPTVSPATVLALGAGASIGLVLLLGWITSIFVALAVAAPLTAAVVWLLIRVAESRYIKGLDAGLTAAVGRMSALLRSGNGFRQALVKLLGDMEPGPLKTEWQFLLDRQGMPLAGREGIATPTQVVVALSTQTLSRRHATFLNHLSVAASQPQDVLVTRVSAAYEALQASDRRREEAVTELAQMRYSGMAVGLAGIVMAGYLALTQWTRMVAAYSSPLGMIVGVIVALALLLPIAGGMLLSQADDVAY